MRQIEILASADLDLKNIEEYLLRKWSLNGLSDFYEKYDRALEIISSDHVVLSQYEDTEFRKYILTRHNTIVYKIEGDIIYIVRVLQNYQDPEENYKSLQP
ncbi:type II toxin-antitoxin system RelE/ParE family toxin [Chryseobacterium hagamense]|uniref:Type II toxin-antitoxin system RelE/ParE family toxin n=1 Tax=Chryseobacterium hagamense TaxID=395935 RepID=A0A511YRS0_9FLAO|nr:hypothetical protein [Chryseobacterium hagamense]GEN77891.1 hypothetical protein CHA01nite_36310 [Chryseobacterium hagamense]